jgi:hypothetical protein
VIHITVRCRRCLGDHPAKSCAYDATEAQAAHDARLRAEPRLAMYSVGQASERPGSSLRGSRLEAINRDAPAVRLGPPPVPAVIQRRKAAERARAFRQRQKAEAIAGNDALLTTTTTKRDNL